MKERELPEISRFLDPQSAIRDPQFNGGAGIGTHLALPESSGSIEPASYELLSCMYLITGGIEMSPKFYSFLWVLFAVSAAVLWLGGVFTMLAAVVFGFVAFGLIFVGMMCVLPGTVSHNSAPEADVPSRNVDPAFRQDPIRASHAHFPAAWRLH